MQTTQYDENGVEKLLYLKECRIGDRSLRYVVLDGQLGVYEKFESSVAGRFPAPQENVFLFLGADVLAGTVFSTKNMNRIHAKYAQYGLACKVGLPYRLAQVPGCMREHWFYDVNGVMKVCFDSYTRCQSKVFAKELFQLWQASDNDSRLKTLVTVLEGSIIDYSMLPSSPTKVDAFVQTEFLSEATLDRCSVADCSTSSQVVAEFREFSCQVCEASHSLPPEKLVSEPTAQTKSMEPNSPLDTFVPLFDASMEPSFSLLEQINVVLKSFQRIANENIIFYKVFVIVEAFIDLLRGEADRIEKTATGLFPLHLMTEYSKASSRIQESVSKNEASSLNLEGLLSSTVLELVSTWLGQQFFQFKPVISGQVELFKMSQLQGNPSLPNAESLVSGSDLYPAAMICLLREWMGYEYSESTTQFLFARMLLILELLNGSLVTGVGHVVYAKLKSSSCL